MSDSGSGSDTLGSHLYRVLAALSHRATAADVADGVVREAAAALGARAGIVALLDDTGKHFQLVSAFGYPPGVLEGWNARGLDDNRVAELIRRGEPLFSSSRVGDPRLGDSGLEHAFGDGASLTVPLKAAGRVIGGLSLSFDRVREFDRQEREFVSSLAAHCALSLERARLFEAELTARAAAEAARRELHAVLEQLPAAVVIVTRDGRVEFNEQVQRLSGTSAPRQGGRLPQFSFDRMRHLDGRAYSVDELPALRALRGDTITGEQMRLTHAEGEERVVRVNAGPIRDDGEIRSAVAVFIDITAEHQAVEDLRRSRRRYDAVLRATNDVIWEWDPGAAVLTWNGSLTRLFGHDPEAANAYPGGAYAWWVAQIHPDDVAVARASYERAIAEGRQSWISEYRFRRADGTYVPTLDRCIVERDAQGRVIRVVGAMTDVSEQHRLLEELRGSVRVREDFLSIAAHELRTPLAALSAQLLGLERLPLDEGARQKKVAAAQRQVNRLTALVNELLDVSRITEGKLRLDCEEADLVAIVQEAMARLGEDFRREQVQLSLHTPTAVTGRWDRLRIDLVVTNLLVNALHYGRKQPVDVRLEADGDVARVVVTDCGIGIPAAERERVFERFARAVPDREYGGLGIGLWLARQVVEAHGGTLTVNSEEGVGSQFVVALPRWRA